MAMEAFIDICTGSDGAVHFQAEDSIWLLGCEYGGVAWKAKADDTGAELLLMRSNLSDAAPPSSHPNASSSSASSSSSTSSSSSSASSSVSKPNDPPPKGSYTDFLCDLYTRIWCTYRRDFSPIPGSQYTSDAGWGCMHRSAQMLITQAFLCCKLGRDWRLTKSSALPREYVETLRLVSDHPDAPFSIHKIALQGKCLGKEVGQWFGPSTAINAVQQLHAIHQRTAFNMFIADDGVVYLDQLRRAARSPQDPDADTFSPVLLMIPVRVGLDRLNPLYLSAIRECFHYRQSLGIIGGRPRASLYFVASQGNTLLYLDPHVVQPAVNMGKKRFDHSSYHCKALKRINIVDADPSMAIAFLIHTQQDLDEFAARTFEICGQSDSYVFSVCKETPDHKSVLCDFEDDADLDDFVAL
eukprot:TRINITY_DN5135_c1_g3_i4.p1 TRINITY_DN5135_c1_g3~~TRINITY_DN5135_c1_g3_i4.p1  ORF type:complete len:412 (+),score=109.88 TRINITY_DN5135_c1_g3_i4:189-1424(+)